jgi:hypothetical protein
MTSDSDTADRPAWLPDGSVLHAHAQDIVSGQQLRLWREDTAPDEHEHRLRRPRRIHSIFYVEDVASGAALGRLDSWEDAIAWHDRRVISCGWETVGGDFRADGEAAADSASEVPARGALGSLRLRGSGDQEPSGGLSGDVGSLTP